MGTSTLQRVWTRTVRPSARGRDLVVGDVHGCFRTLDRALCELRFDTDSDRLFGVGDLVDRGPHSGEALVWLETRFEAVVMGNQERPLLYWFDPHRCPSSAHRPEWLRRVPRTLGRALGQGVLHARLPRDPQGVRPAEASPRPAHPIRHEGQRSVAELGAILWRAMGGPDEPPELGPWMAPPHTDPIVALALSRRRLAEYATPEPIDRSCAFPGGRVWLIEIERAQGDVPGGIAVWRSPGADAEWRTRCACIWTRGPVGSPTHPLVIGAQWDAHGNDAVAAAYVIGPSWGYATGEAKDASRDAWLARRRNAIGNEMMARIVVPAAFAWLDC